MDDWEMPLDAGLATALCELKRCLDMLDASGPHGSAQDEAEVERLVESVDDDWSAPEDEAAAPGWERNAVDIDLGAHDLDAPPPGPLAETPLQSVSGLSVYLSEIRSVPPLSAADEKILALRVREGDAGAAARMIRAHLGLVVVVARSLRSPSMTLEDSIGDGNMGLIEAVSRFDPDRGVRFGTYARFWIKQSIRQGILDHSRTVRLPVHVIRDVTRVLREQRNAPPPADRGAALAAGAGSELGRIAQATGKTVKDVAQLMTHAQLPLSMDLPVGGGEESLVLADTIEDTGRGDPESKLVSDQMLDTLLACVNSLAKVERVVILRRYGFETGEPDTLENVGSMLGLTAERVRQIQKGALPKLREALLQRGLDAAALFG